jgi:murein DD-endopeptidase MepM/ murein hydrolase activator NlpD
VTYRPRHGRARPGPRRTVAGVGAGIVLALLGLGLVWLLHPGSAAQARAHRTRARGGDLAAPTPAAQDPSAAPAPRLLPFAEAEGITLRLPSARVACVCFHEASFSWTRALTPIGRLAHNYNRTKFALADAHRAPAPRYIVMSSRGRRTGATTAADVVLPRRTPVASPVSGTVTKVKRYRLYGRYPDMQVEIRPQGHPGLRVVLIHLDEVRVRAGDPVSATHTVLGIPRVFPFGTQTDDYIGGRLPHVHVEITSAHPGRPARD